MTYEEGRKWYQLLGKLSADETSKLPPVVRHDLIDMVVGLKNDIGNAASQVGRGYDYYKAMNQFRRGSQLNNAKQAVTNEVVPNMVKGAAYGAGGAAAGGTLYGLWRLLSGR